MSPEIVLAHIRLNDGYRSHSWPVEDSIDVVADGVEIDGYLVENATLEQVERVEAVTTGGSKGGLLGRLRGAL